MREIKTCPDHGWQQMPTEDLDRILQAELEKEHPNEEVVLPILRELEDREKNRPVKKTPEVLELTKKLSEYETSSKQSIHKCKWLAGAAVAAVICIVIMALPQTVGAESIFDVLFRWTSGVFEFIDPDKNETYPNTQSDFSADHPGLQQLYEEVTKQGVTEAVVPMWLPEGFELWDLEVIPLSDGGSKINAAFDRNGKNIIVAYRITPSIVAKYEKKDAAFEVYDCAGVRHFILDNEDKLSVTWTVNDAECSIVAEIPKDDIYKIIKSIYRRDL